jgi:ATP-dependent RNA helicase RhlE
MDFTSLGLAPELLRALDGLGYTTPTEIQLAAIPPVLAGRDVLAAAQTGTGKTAAFALPLLQRLSEGKPAGPLRPRALVLTPTRELAAQVLQSARDYGRHYRVRGAVVFGGVGMQPQIDALRRGVDLLIATPGRLLDHMQRRTVDLSAIEVLVLDEGDRMLDMGFLPALRRILAALPRERQTLLFSATFPEPIKILARQFMRSPVEVQATPSNSAAPRVQHVVHPVDLDRKRDLLLQLLAVDSRRQTLVFSRTKHGADKLCRVLQQAGFGAAAIHGNKSQNARTRALSDFKAGRVSVLVATDIAARGIDIEQLPAVVNYDLPMVAEDYVHRIGRTGRAGSDGLAMSLVCAEESAQLRAIDRLLGAPIARVEVEGFVPTRPLHGTAPGRQSARPSAAPRRPAAVRGAARHHGGGRAAGAAAPAAQRNRGPR